MSLALQGTNLSTVGVDLYAYCGRSQFYAPVNEGVNLQICSPIGLVKQVPVQVRLKPEGGGQLRAGNTQGYRIPKALDYLNEVWLLGTMSPVKYTGPAGSYARFRQNWMVYALHRVLMSVQDLPLLEIDNNCQIFYIQNYIAQHQRENVDLMMGNSGEFLSKVQGTAPCANAGSPTWAGPVFGSSRPVAMPLGIYAAMLGSSGARLVTGSMLFSEVLIEIELNPIHHLFEVINTECMATPTAGCVGSVSQIYQCDGSCPDWTNMAVYAHGAIGTPEEKKALAKRVYAMPIKTLMMGAANECLDCDVTSFPLRLSLATTAIHVGVFNTTETQYSDVASTILGGHGVSPVAKATLWYDSSERAEVDVLLSKMAQVGFSTTPGAPDRYTIVFPFSFDMSSACFTQATEFARIANAYVDIRLTNEARLAQQGFDQFGNPIASSTCATIGGKTAVDGGVRQKFTVKTAAAVWLPVNYSSGSVSLTI
uniref:Major capsid protein n=1 Tax=viral metagenome TaxID=1070528 RepID=A0A6C0JTP5_9ZZZZ